MKPEGKHHEERQFEKKGQPQPQQRPGPGGQPGQQWPGKPSQPTTRPEPMWPGQPGKDR